jgi:hypothetical protein
MSRALTERRPYPRLRRRYAAPMLAGRRTIGAALAAIGAALIVVGCGGGGSQGSASTASDEPLTKRELVARGDSICGQAGEQFQELRQSPPTTPEGAADLTQKLIDIQQSELTRIRDLNAPASLRSSLRDYLRSLEKNIAVLKQGLRAAQRNDAAAYARAQAKTVREQVERLELARAVGFKKCSRPAGAAPSNAGG